MGCTTSGDTVALAFNDFQLLKLGTQSIELTQLFLVANNLLSEVQQLYKKVEGNRLILLRITKVSLTANQTLIDAFGFWTRYVSICNLGQGGQNGVFYKFENEGKYLNYSLGLNGDLKLQWFGEVLNDYLKVLEGITKIIPSILEQLKVVLEKVVGMTANIKEKNQASRHNISLLKFNISFIKIINIKIIKYNEELEMLRDKYKQVAENADEQGIKLYKKYGVRKLLNEEKYCLKTKLNILIEQCFQGQMRTELEYEMQRKEKDKRRLKKPAWTFGDDIGIGIKKFPFRIRWTGCECVDHSFFIISNYLENHSKHLLLLRKLSVILRYLTQAYKTDEDTLARAWSIFCCYLNERERSIIQNSMSILEGIKRLKLKNQNAEKCRKYFIQYIEQFDKELLDKLEQEWSNYQEGQSKVLSLWSNNQIFATIEFQELDIHDKYYALTSMAKNVYALQHYFPVATKIYNTVYQKKLTKGKDFLNEMQSIYISSGIYSLPFENLHTLNKAEDEAIKVKNKEIKFKYAYDKFEQKG
ncbi:unnamed protein product (macronuclear) [Paramecium tetraurelia]|uniref:Uncharacterized protein n=1 Tax=Paramecium tetraurelia TaxID=5888 RepID=A0DLH2_PARTE|nr:uncharacterized protein GSPATT00018206001 [Paramecium tetraurelia]CAK83889.1 unnamed protein product [Paramecium tetraurelia]|eukprot:XP_001451286.1 hypothetical protein (macronuclear) [Paramecium tetraurelia strain d4-2]